MRRLSEWDAGDLVAYNLRGGGNEFTVFGESQPERVAKARCLVTELLPPFPATIVEPGCSTGDISGFFASDHIVVGIDMTPGAVVAARKRWPGMTVIDLPADIIEPMPCDILVLCEFLEHIVDPIDFVHRWLPKAKAVVIGHPLVGTGTDPEPGHVWAYDMADYQRWFEIGGHVMHHPEQFEMGPYRMVIGSGARK